MGNTQRYTLAKINLLPIAKFGFLLGSLAMLLPSLLCVGITTTAISALRTWLDGWQAVPVEQFGVEMTQFNFISLLQLGPVQQAIIQMDNQPFAVALFVIIGCLLGGGAFIGLIVLSLGWGYNLLAAISGGVELELRNVS
ncbi:hypothetical protein QUF63_04170 [Anaerolineales bacterium HSG25]|nr:hypothetical protein [Anaerolineales bacterium HSG25]